MKELPLERKKEAEFLRLLDHPSLPRMIDYTEQENRCFLVMEYTPLHDGAVVMRGNRIVAATCYLPLSDNMELSKQLGTRHRAGVGISEAAGGGGIIVSEETGQVSVAQDGILVRDITSSQLKEILKKAQNKTIIDNNRLRQFFKGRSKHEGKTDK